jgi:hypothetical protein
VVEASARIGQSPEARLRWLLHFAEEVSQKAAHLSGRELEEKNAELYAFFVVPTRAGSPHYGRRLVQLSARALGQLAREARDKLRNLGSGRGPFTIRLKNVQRHVLARSDGSHFAVYDAANPRAAFLMEMADVLAQTRLRRCQRTECSRLFVPRKRQGYCTNRCSILERTRRFREYAPREQRSETRHWLYVRQVAKKHGISEAKAEAKIRRRSSDLRRHD